MVVLVGGEMSYTMLKVRGNIRGICPRGGEKYAGGIVRIPKVGD